MSPKPLYLGIADALRTLVETAAPNALLPTEQQLARRFGVSRVTVRLAISMLERAGLVSRQRGRGTTVSPPKIKRHVVPVTTLEQDLRQQGLKLETEVLSFEAAVRPPDHIRERLQLTNRDRAGRLRLVRRVDQLVIGHDERYFPKAVAARLDPDLARTEAVPDILQDLAGMDIVQATWETEITPAPGSMAEVLGITPGNLVFINTFVHRLANGAPVEAGFMAYRMDRVKFVFLTSGAMLALRRSRRLHARV